MNERRVIDGPIDAMIHPVVCRCGAIYDLAGVHVIARHADCSVWKTKCCGITVDDRIPGWGGPRKYRDLRTTPEIDIHGIYYPAET